MRVLETVVDTRNDHVSEQLPGSGDDSPPENTSPDYRPPLLVAVGRVRDATKGSSMSGKADANSQYYW